MIYNLYILIKYIGSISLLHNRSEQIFLIADQIWQSDLAALFGESEAVHFRDSLAHQGINLSVVPAARSAPSTGDELITIANSISPEFLFHIVALIIYSLQYASVFLHTSTHFSVLFAIQLLSASVFHVFSLSGECMLVKFQVNERVFANIQLLLSPIASVVLFAISNAAVFLSAFCLFAYGYNQYVQSCLRTITSITSVNSNGEAISRATDIHHRSICLGYKVHLTAAVALIVLLISRIPMLYDYIIIYRMTSLMVVLTCGIVELSYMVIWMLLWLRLTVRQKWQFRVGLCADNVLAKLQAEWNADTASTSSHQYHHISCNCPRDVTAKRKTIFTIAVTRDTNDTTGSRQTETTPLSEDPSGLIMRQGSVKSNSAAQRVKFDDSFSDDDERNQLDDADEYTFPESVPLDEMSANNLPQRRAQRPTDLSWAIAGDVESSIVSNTTFSSEMPDLRNSYYGRFSPQSLNDIPPGKLAGGACGQRVKSPPQRQGSFQQPRRRFQAIAEETSHENSGEAMATDSNGRLLPPYKMRHAQSDNVYRPSSRQHGPVNILLPWQLNSAKTSQYTKRPGPEGSDSESSRLTSPVNEGTGMRVMGRRHSENSAAARPSSSTALTPDKDKPFEVERYKLKMGVGNTRALSPRIGDADKRHSLQQLPSASSATSQTKTANDRCPPLYVHVPAAQFDKTRPGKSELAERDSANPSSNETSSNESSESQVLLSAV